MSAEDASTGRYAAAGVWPLYVAGSEAQWITSHNVPIRLIEINGRIRAMIEVPDTCTRLALEEAVPLALKWRDRLMGERGPVLDDRGAFLESLSSKQQTGTSYASLAARANAAIERSLRGWQAYQRAMTDAAPKMKTQIDWIVWSGEMARASFEAKQLGSLAPESGDQQPPAALDTRGLESARNILAWLGVSDDDAENDCRRALNRIANGDAAFGEDGWKPVDRERIINAIKAWRKNKMHTLAAAVGAKA